MLHAFQEARLEFIAAGGKSLDGGPGLRTIPLANLRWQQPTRRLS